MTLHVILYDSASLNKASYSNHKLKRETWREVDHVLFKSQTVCKICFSFLEILLPQHRSLCRLPLGPEQQMSMSHYE